MKKMKNSTNKSERPGSSSGSTSRENASPKTGENPDTSPERSENPDISPERSENPDTSLERSENPDTSPERGENPDTSPERSENPDTSPERSENPDASPKSSERQNTSPESSVRADSSPKGNERADASPKSTARSDSSQESCEKAADSPGSDDARDSSQQKEDPFPRSVFFILGNEFCERYTFYGLRTVLYLFCTDQLLMSDDTAAAVFHSFTMMAYFFPIPGAIVADSWLGRFRTILYLSCVYAAGCVVLAAGSVPGALATMTALSMVGLVTISAGTGGIKPCVAAFGGNQFSARQESQQQTFFSLFYFAINCGSILSTITTPILRSDVRCFGELTCFPLAFGVPAVLMIVAIVVFVAGKSLYIIRPPEGNLIPRVCKCICYAIGKRFARLGEKRQHWLDYADDKFDQGLIDDTKRLLRILKLYLPLPIYWALFDQQGSRWTQQAKQLNGNIVDLFIIRPDQMQTLNPIFVIIFIPMFQLIVYPILDKLSLLTKPLQRITAGGLLASMAFVCAGFLQLRLEAADLQSPNPLHSELVLINNSPCRISVQQWNFTVQPFTNSIFRQIPVNSTSNTQLVPGACEAQAPLNATMHFNSSVLSYMVTLDNGNLVGLESRENRTFLADDGNAYVKIFYNLDIADTTNATFKISGKRHSYYVPLASGTNLGRYGVTEFVNVSAAVYAIYLPLNGSAHYDAPMNITHFESGKYILSVYNASGSAEARSTVFELAFSDSISILYQIPQYAIITAAEVLLSITGLEFSYTQAPPSMKSVVQAAWLATTGIGNMLVAVISESRPFERLSSELFFYAVLMASVMVAFAVLAHFYQYVDPAEYKESRSDLQRRGSLVTPRTAP